MSFECEKKLTFTSEAITLLKKLIPIRELAGGRKMLKPITILTSIFFIIVSSNSFADGLSVLMKTPATMLDVGVIKLEKRLIEIAEHSNYPKGFGTPKVTVISSRNRTRPRGIEIQVDSQVPSVFKTKEEAIEGCKNWFSFMRNMAGYDTKSQRYILDKDDKTDDKHSFFVWDFDSEGYSSTRGFREIIEDSFRLYCSAAFYTSGYDAVTIIGKIGESGYQILE